MRATGRQKGKPTMAREPVELLHFINMEQSAKDPIFVVHVDTHTEGKRRHAVRYLHVYCFALQYPLDITVMGDWPGQGMYRAPTHYERVQFALNKQGMWLVGATEDYGQRCMHCRMCSQKYAPSEKCYDKEKPRDDWRSKPAHKR